jgi:membrane protein
MFKQNPFIQRNIDPAFIDSINHFLIKYAAPLVISFLIFFIVYKWIPEKKVYTRGALTAALLSTVVWEVIKRAYAFYLENISVLVAVLSKLGGSFLAIILFAFWMEISFTLLLIGVKLTSIIDRNRDHGKKSKTEETG